MNREFLKNLHFYVFVAMFIFIAILDLLLPENYKWIIFLVFILLVCFASYSANYFLKKDDIWINLKNVDKFIYAISLIVFLIPTCYAIKVNFPFYSIIFLGIFGLFLGFWIIYLFGSKTLIRGMFGYNQE